MRHGAVAVGHADAVYLHGGSTVAPVHIFDDLWVFQRATGWTQLFPATPHPRGRSYHAAALLTGPRPAMVVFGGANCTGSCQCFNDMWLLELQPTPAWQRVSITTDIDTRYHHSLTISKGVARTFGGESYVPRYMYHNSVAAIALEPSGLGLGAVLGLVGLSLAALLALARFIRPGKKHSQ